MREERSLRALHTVVLGETGFLIIQWLRFKFRAVLQVEASVKLQTREVTKRRRTHLGIQVN